jgi:hypothetical protein
MEDSMKRIIIAAALLLGTVLAAQARPATTYHDLIRPNGHPRSQAIYQGNLDFCYRQTGQSRYSPDGPAFRQCMASRGYRFVSQSGWGRARDSGRGGPPDIYVTSPDNPAPAPFVQPAPDIPPAPTPDNPLCGGGLC